jgi:hypothetical protein
MAKLRSACILAAVPSAGGRATAMEPIPISEPTVEHSAVTAGFAIKLYRRLAMRSSCIVTTGSKAFAHSLSTKMPMWFEGPVYTALT